MTESDTTSPIRKRLIAAAVALGTVLGVAGVAGALTGQSDSSTDDSTQVTQDDDGTGTDEADEADDDGVDATGADESGETDDDRDGRGHRDGDRGEETLLEGDLADQVGAAALEEMPGATIERVETDADGAAYEAHVIDANGNPATIHFDSDLNVVDTRTGEPGEGRHGDHRDGGDEAPVTGDLAAQLTAAAEEAVPGGTVDRVESEGDGYEAHVTDADGNEVEVHFDADLNVIDTEQD